MPEQQTIYNNTYLSGSLYPLQKRYEVLSSYFAFNSVTSDMTWMGQDKEA